MKTTIHIQGMHCKSCEVILEKQIKKVKGITDCQVSHKKGVAEIESKNQPSIKTINHAIESSGYQVVSEEEKKTSKAHKNTFNDYLDIGFVLIIVATVAFVLKELEFSKLLPDLSGQVNPLIAIGMGVVASLSTCLILVGGLVMSFGEMYPVHPDAKHPILSRATPHLYFHAGRVGAFVLLGGLLGLVGSKITYSLSFTGWLTAIVAIVMLYIGMQILNIVPNITKLGFHLPKSLSKKISDLEGNNHHLTPILIGALTFFLPCGFTQSMQLAAVASGSFATGALIMGAFALGTLPALISIGMGSSYARQNKFGFLNKTIGVIIVFFAVYSLNSGFVLAGGNLNFWSSGKNIEATTISGDVQVVKMDVDWSFEPNEFKIKKGVPVRWEINGINVSGCSNKIVIPKMGLSKDIVKGLNVLEFTPEKSGTLPFSCWMGMIGGKFIVTD